MGTMTFQLPSVAANALRELKRTCMAGGPDNMPWPTELHFAPNQLRVSRAVDESGYLIVPWAIDGRGQMMGTSATLIERTRPYNLLVELARGKVNQVRCQAFDWRSGGLQLSDELDKLIQDASLAFGRAITGVAPEQASPQAQIALNLAYKAADQLVRAYVQQVFQIRHQRQARLDTTVACNMSAAIPPPSVTAELVPAFNGVCLPFSWNNIENEEAMYRWEECDALVDWALKQKLDVSAGPLIDFSSANLPAWLWLWERDLPSLASFMCKFVETTVRRYRSRIRRWQLTAASNCANVLALSEDDLLGLTYRLAESARQIDPSLELIVGIAQPWGEYMALADRTHSPFIFADTLIRSGLNLTALGIELVMGVTPRGSYCRDLLEISRLLDLYALLGVPLRVTLGYPSSAQPDANADPDLHVEGGHWGSGFSPEVQADWAADVTALVLCKPFVQSVRWTHARDAEPHQFPHCGVFDAQDAPKPALRKLRELRETHLK
ncbi:MAG TPA: endo-1,4-beta-xylanase [Gemmataceae bacterium]|jgi:GH35 family endo-1,4-beta-xylanase